MSAKASAAGESVNGFPNWVERVLLERTNRARCDPQYEMARCPTNNCGEKASYSPTAPLVHNERLNRAPPLGRAVPAALLFARLAVHDRLEHRRDLPGYVRRRRDVRVRRRHEDLRPRVHDVRRTRVALRDLARRRDHRGRDEPRHGVLLVALRGLRRDAVPVRARASDERPPLAAAQGHGAGRFRSWSPPVRRRLLGRRHDPEDPVGRALPAAVGSVQVWASWYDAAGAPSEALVDVDGTGTPMTLQRGSATNGAVVAYPSTGSLGIGPSGSCAGWDTSRPALGAGRGVASGNDAWASGADAGNGANAGAGFRAGRIRARARRRRRASPASSRRRLGRRRPWRARHERRRRGARRGRLRPSPPTRFRRAMRKAVQDAPRAAYALRHRRARARIARARARA